MNELMNQSMNQSMNERGRDESRRYIFSWFDLLVLRKDVTSPQTLDWVSNASFCPSVRPSVRPSVLPRSLAYLRTYSPRSLEAVSRLEDAAPICQEVVERRAPLAAPRQRLVVRKHHRVRLGVRLVPNEIDRATRPTNRPYQERCSQCS